MFYQLFLLSTFLLFSGILLKKSIFIDPSVCSTLPIKIWNLLEYFYELLFMSGVVNERYTLLQQSNWYLNYIYELALAFDLSAILLV